MWRRNLRVLPEPDHPIQEPELPAVDKSHPEKGGPDSKYQQAKQNKQQPCRRNRRKDMGNCPVVKRYGNNVAVHPDPLAQHSLRSPCIIRCRSGKDAGVVPDPKKGENNRDNGIPPQPEPAPGCKDKERQGSVAQDYAPGVGMTAPRCIIHRKGLRNLPLKGHFTAVSVVRLISSCPEKDHEKK